MLVTGETLRHPQHSCTAAGEPMCSYGKHVIGPDDYYYVVNPVGGYGLDEVLCCENCIKKPENKIVRQRMINAGAKELVDEGVRANSKLTKAQLSKLKRFARASIRKAKRVMRKE